MRNLHNWKYEELKTKRRIPRRFNIGSVIGSSTGEYDFDSVPGGWEGTDDATSTAPSDLRDIDKSPSGIFHEPNLDRIGNDLNTEGLNETKFPKGKAF